MDASHIQGQPKVEALRDADAFVEEAFKRGVKLPELPSLPPEATPPSSDQVAQAHLALVGMASDSSEVIGATIREVAVPRRQTFLERLFGIGKKRQKEFDNFIDQKFKEIKDSIPKPIRDEKEIKKLLTKAAELKTGTSKLITYAGREVMISKSPVNGKIDLSIQFRALKDFASGSFGDIRDVYEFGEKRSQAEKRAKNGEKARKDIANEAENLKLLEGEKGVQAPPHKVNKNGYVGQRYNGDGTRILELLKLKAAENTSPQTLISNLNSGLKAILKKGRYHIDHKLENTFFTYQKGTRKIDLVVADLGGDITLTEEKVDAFVKAKQNFEQVRAKRNEGKATLKELGKARVEMQEAGRSLIPASTPYTTCSRDVDKTEKLIPDDETVRLASMTNQERLKALQKLMEARVVFSQAIVSLMLLSGKTSEEWAKQENDFFDIDWIGNGMVFKFDNLDAFKEKLNQVIPGVSDGEAHILFQALNNDSEKRPTLEDFSKVWEQSGQS